MVVSVAIIGAAIGSFLGGPAADKFGRKPTIIISDVMFTVGAVVMGFSQSLVVLIIGRFIVGVIVFS